MGNINYDYVWSVGNNPHVTATPESGNVAKGGRAVCRLVYNPKVPEILDNYKVFCQVVNADRYSMVLSGQGHQPQEFVGRLYLPTSRKSTHSCTRAGRVGDSNGCIAMAPHGRPRDVGVNFSFHQYNFGPSFLWKLGMEKSEAVLIVTNEDRMDVSYELLFKDTPWLEADAPPTVLAPGDQDTPWLEADAPPTVLAPGDQDTPWLEADAPPTVLAPGDQPDDVARASD
eukprot:293531-Pyramimonas_sp.AAC.1